jgi:hypothetical protein
MIRVLFLLLPLLTDHAVLVAVLDGGFIFAAANTGILCFAGAFEAARRLNRNSNLAHPSIARDLVPRQT